MRKTINTRYVFLEPAYGRRYDSQEKALADWQAGKDFKIVNGPYCSIRDREMMAFDLRDPTVLLEFQKGEFVAV